MEQPNSAEHASLHFLIGCRHRNATILGQREVVENIDQEPPGDRILIEQRVVLKAVGKHKEQPGIEH